MNTKRILLLLLGVVAVWFLFIRKRNSLPQAVVVNRPATPASAANTAASQSIATAAQAAQPGIAQLTGILMNGIVTSIGQWGTGGSSGADTGSTDSWGEFSNSDLTGFGQIN